MTNKKGYIIPEGKKDELVPETITIYGTSSLKSVIRQGKKTIKDSDGKALTVQNMGEAYQIARKQLEDSQKKASVKIAPFLGKQTIIASSVNQEEIISRNAAEIYNTSLTDYKSEEESADAILEQIMSDFADIESSPDINGGFTKQPLSAKIKKRYKAIEKKLEKACAPIEKAANVEKAVANSAGNVALASVSKWFDEQEAIIDALPTMAKMGNDVYVVEYKEVNGKKDWYYTGEHVPADRVANQRIQELKANVCAFLTKKMEMVNEKINDTLTEQLNRLEKCKPFTIAMEVISSVPSLGTIIKWATSVIDFFVSAYKMIFSIIKTAIQILELVILRGPQLINKILTKVTEFDCPISFNITVNKKE